MLAGLLIAPPKPSGVTEDAHERHHQTAVEDTASPVGMSFVSVIDQQTLETINEITLNGIGHQMVVSMR
jgi:hypothetical protein